MWQGGARRGGARCGEGANGAFSICTLTVWSGWARPGKARLVGLGLLWAILAVAAPANAQEFRTPSELVDELHRAFSKNDGTRVASLMAADYSAFEFGYVDSNLAQYVQNAPTTTWNLESRRMGGAGDQFWVLSTYKVTGASKSGVAINDVVLETVVVRRLNGQFRIAHFHWSAAPAV